MSAGLPDWKAYVDFLNNIVVEGLVRVAVTSLEYLVAQVDPEVIARFEQERQALLYAGEAPQRRYRAAANGLEVGA